MKKKMFGLLGLLMMLSVAALSQELKTAGNFSQDFGHVMVKFSPEWDTENPKLQMGHLVNIRQYLPDLQRGSGPTLGINRHTPMGKHFSGFTLTIRKRKKTGDSMFRSSWKMAKNTRRLSAGRSVMLL